MLNAVREEGVQLELLGYRPWLAWQLCWSGFHRFLQFQKLPMLGSVNQHFCGHNGMPVTAGLCRSEVNGGGT